MTRNILNKDLNDEVLQRLQKCDNLETETFQITQIFYFNNVASSASHDFENLGLTHSLEVPITIYKNQNQITLYMDRFNLDVGDLNYQQISTILPLQFVPDNKYHYVINRMVTGGDNQNNLNGTLLLGDVNLFPKNPFFEVQAGLLRIRPDTLNFSQKFTKWSGMERGIYITYSL